MRPEPGALGASRCAAHPIAEALFDCDGCRRALCVECVRSAGRLMICRHCGELAVQRTAPTTPREAARAAPGAPVGSLGDLLGYPLRGRQGVLTAVVLVELALFVASEEMLGEAGCLFALPRALLLALIPGILGDVWRSTAGGRRDLDEFPDYGSLGARLRELLAFVFVGIWALLPAATLLAWTDCGARLARGEALGRGCVVLLGVGSIVGAALWLPAFTRAAATGELVGWLRVGEHLRLLARAPSSSLRGVGICWVALLAGASLRTLLGSASLPAILAESLGGAYGAIVAARAAGFWAREAGFEP